MAFCGKVTINFLVFVLLIPVLNTKLHHLINVLLAELPSALATSLFIQGLSTFPLQGVWTCLTEEDG